MQQRSLAAAPVHEESYRLALAAGVEVMLGSDLPPFWPIEGTSATVRELEHMEAFGLPARDALLAATRGPAAWLGIGERRRLGDGGQAGGPDRDDRRSDGIGRPRCGRCTGS